MRYPRRGIAVVAATAIARRVPNVTAYVRTMALFVAFWWALARWTANPALLPSPFAVVEAIIELVADGEIFMHAGISLGRMLLSLGLASLLAIPLGLAMGLRRTLDELVDPVVELLRPISGIAWIPLALFMFGIGNVLPVFIMTYAAFFPILLGTIAGVRSVDRRLIDVARTMGVARRTIVARVVVPAALRALLGRVVSRAPDDPAGDGVHRDDRRAGLSDRPHAACAGATVHALGHAIGRCPVSAWAARAARSVVLPLTLLVVWEAWGVAYGNSRTPTPSRVIGAAIDIVT